MYSYQKSRKKKEGRGEGRGEGSGEGRGEGRGGEGEEGRGDGVGSREGDMKKSKRRGELNSRGYGSKENMIFFILELGGSAINVIVGIRSTISPLHGSKSSEYLC